MAAAAATHRCSHCSRDFGRAEHLRRHERTHTKEKPYICDLCPEAYSRRDLLRRHEIKVHDISTGIRQRRKSQSQNSSEPSPLSSQYPRRGSKASVVARESSLQDPPRPEPAPSQQNQQPQIPDQTQHAMLNMCLPPHFEHPERWSTNQRANAEPQHQVFGGQLDVDYGPSRNGYYDHDISCGLSEDVNPSVSLDPALMEPSLLTTLSHIPELNHSLTPTMSFNMFAPVAQDLTVNPNLRVSQEYWNHISAETTLQVSPHGDRPSWGAIPPGGSADKA